MMVKNILFVTSGGVSSEALLSLTSTLLNEGHPVGVLGPTHQALPGVQVFTKLQDAAEFAPDVVYPLDERAAIGLRHVGFNQGKVLNGSELAHTLNGRWAFGLSMLAKTGARTVDYQVLTNENDYLAFHAKQSMDQGAEWLVQPDFGGEIAIRREAGDIVHLCYIISGKHLLEPALSYWPLTGLLARGGLPDYRGVYLKPCWSEKIAYFGNKLLITAQAVGASGLMFLDLLVPKDNPGQCKIMRVSTVPPAGFLAALTSPGFLKRSLGLLLLSLAKGARAELVFSDHAFAHLVTHSAGPAERLPPDLLQVTGPGVPYHWAGYVRGENAIPSDHLWEYLPCAEVKLDADRTAEYANRKLIEYHLQAPKEDSTNVSSDGETTDSGGDSCGSSGGPELDPCGSCDPVAGAAAG